MLEINFEFRKGICFMRLIGNLCDKSYYQEEEKIKEIIIFNKFKYIVINTNYINQIDLDGINYLLEIFYMTRLNNSNLVICDKNNFFKRLLNNDFPVIKDELEVL